MDEEVLWYNQFNPNNKWTGCRLCQHTSVSDLCILGGIDDLIDQKLHLWHLHVFATKQIQQLKHAVTRQ